MTYKYCIVPECGNTSTKTPNKLFFNVPSHAKIRKKWCSVMKRNIPLSTKTTRYCCEDHFDVEVDMENYIKYKLVGGRLVLKKGVLPHKFQCQKPVKKTIERNAFKKRRAIEFFQRVLSKNIEHEKLIPDDIVFQDCGTSDDHDTDPLFVPENTEQEPDKKVHKNKAVQVKITEKTKHQSTNTPPKWKGNQRRPKKFLNLKKLDRKLDIVSEITKSNTSSFKCTNADRESIESEMIIIEKENSFKSYMQKGAIMAMFQESKLLTGIPQHSQFCLQHLQNFTRLPLLEIVVALRKIRCHEPNSMLAIHFGVPESLISNYINKAVPRIARFMKELITFPPTGDIRKNLPILFRRRYSKVTSIIDCFEIQIEKPSDAIHQALTWSEYKNCNTIKYLISTTPDGLINFISEGYGGRTSDSNIFEDSKLINELTQGSIVLAERGFENIARLLEQSGCTLVRPPSISSNSKCTKDILQTTTSAALRAPVKRSIGRLRDFEMIGPQATVNISHIHLLDDVVIIASGIVNLQDC